MKQIGSNTLTVLSGASYQSSFVYAKQRDTQKRRQWQREQARHAFRVQAEANRKAWEEKKAKATV